MCVASFLQSQDRFIRGYIETIFRSICVVTVSALIVQVLLQMDFVVLRIDELLFSEFEAVRNVVLLICIADWVKRLTFSLCFNLVLQEHEALHVAGHGHVLKFAYSSMFERVQFFLFGFFVVALLVSFNSWWYIKWIDSVKCDQKTLCVY